MDVQAEKLWLVEHFLKLNDVRLIQALRKIVEVALESQEVEEDFWDELTDEQKRRIEHAIQQANKGETIPHKEVMAEFRKKYAS